MTPPNLTARWLYSLFAAGSLCLASPASPPQSPDRDGSGWTMSRLDLDVHVLPQEHRMEMQGTARLRLDQHAASYGPHLLLNMKLTDAGTPVMRFVDAACDGAEVNVPSELRSGSISQAHVRFATPKRRGDEISVTFSAVSDGYVSQLIVNEQTAIASWTAAWHPFTNSTPNPKFVFNAGILRAPGRTRLELPPGWIGIVDGSLVERTRNDEENVEVWETPDGIARGFAAGPYTAVTERVDGRDIHVYQRSQDGRLAPRELARLIGDAIAAQEAHLGPFPFDSYAAVEAPASLPGQGWAAASQQTFVLAIPSIFDLPGGNLVVWAHEASHAWWGNTVGTRGLGSIWCDESLANLGGLIAIETMEGTEAMHRFLAFSRDGSHPLQCATGYFLLMRKGLDQPLAKLSSGGATQELADSKGAWVHHMLRQQIGDDVFFAVLRAVVDDLAGQSVSMTELRRRFIAAAPDHDLQTFFAQWLDRTGAPVFDLEWHTAVDGTRVYLELAQTQEGEPFALDLDVELELIDGRRVVEQLAVDGASHAFALDTPVRAVGLRLDPGYKLLIWRPEYGPRPGDESPVADLPDELVATVVGTYRFRKTGKDIEVFARDGALFAQTAASPPIGLLMREPGTFHLDMPGKPKIVEFDLSQSPSPSFRGTEGDDAWVAERVK